MTRVTVLVIAGTVVLTTGAPQPPSIAQGQDWTRFRGPDGQGISSATTIPVQWTADDYNWKVELPGVGHSSPVIWDDRVFVTSGDQDANLFYVLAFSVVDGKELWRKEYPVAPYRMNPQSAYAVGSPSVDADRVYAVLPTDRTTLAMALGHDGQEIWTKEFPGVYSQHGPGNSVVAIEGLVVFSHEQRAREGPDATPSRWIALDAETGDVRWTCERESTQISYSTPCVYTPQDGSAYLVFNSNAHGMTGVEIETGKVIWEAKSVLPQRVVSSPVIAGDLLVGTCGQGGGGVRLVAVRAGSGEVVYEARGSQAPYVPTPLAIEGLLFVYHDRGDISCLVAATGEVLWTERPAGTFYGSPVWVNGNLYCITRAGEVVVIRASRTYELLAINPLGEASHATPAVAGGRMYLRTLSHLISIGGAG